MMEDMTAVSALNMMPTTKKQIETFVERICYEVEEGNENPLKLYVQVKALEKAIGDIKSRIEEMAVNEAEKYGERGAFGVYGAMLQIKETGIRYDFSGSEEWKHANDVVEAAKEAMRAVEKRLKTATRNSPYFDPISGEEITGIPKESKTTVTVSFK